MRTLWGCSVSRILLNFSRVLRCENFTARRSVRLFTGYGTFGACYSYGTAERATIYVHGGACYSYGTAESCYSYVHEFRSVLQILSAYGGACSTYAFNAFFEWRLKIGVLARSFEFVCNIGFMRGDFASQLIDQLVFDVSFLTAQGQDC